MTAAESRLDPLLLTDSEFELVKAAHKYQGPILLLDHDARIANLIYNLGRQSRFSSESDHAYYGQIQQDILLALLQLAQQVAGSSMRPDWLKHFLLSTQWEEILFDPGAKLIDADACLPATSATVDNWRDPVMLRAAGIALTALLNAIREMPLEAYQTESGKYVMDARTGVWISDFPESRFVPERLTMYLEQGRPAPGSWSGWPAPYSLLLLGCAIALVWSGW